MTEKLKIKLTIIGILFFSCMNLNAQDFDLGIASGFDTELADIVVGDKLSL